MGKARELRARIKSVRNTRKITRTMELVATAKAKVTQTRLKAVVPYSQTLLGMVSQLAASGARHPLLADAADTDRAGATVIFGITANRGLCGGYNTNVIRLVRETLAAERAAGRTPEVYVAGKKGIASLRFLKVPLAQAYTQFDDKPTFEAVAAVAEPLLHRFAAGAVRRVEICSCRYVSSAQQRPERLTWLPITPPPLEKRPAFEPLLHPDRDQLLSKLLPLVATAGLFQAFVEAATCEQIARRIAMKAATDNADDMIRSLNQTYNRARQAGITQEIAEVIGGAAALE